jgi:putative ABC transport system substrate-binding protein
LATNIPRIDKRSSPGASSSRLSGEGALSNNRRRQFLIAATAVLLAAPAGGQAQQSPKLYEVGILSSARPPSPGSEDPYLAALSARLRELGYSEGRNLRIHVRRAAGDLDRLPGLAAQLVALKVDVILAAGNAATDAARKATRDIPIVMLSADPVAAGFVRSLAHPDGNLTGLSTDAGLAMWGKRLELLKEAAPNVTRVAVLSRTGGQQGAWVAELERAAGRLGVVLIHVGARRSVDFPRAFDAARIGQPDALIASDTPLNVQYRKLILAFTAGQHLPDVHAYREAAEDGALISYGVDIVDLYHRAAAYVDRLLKGTPPAELPVEQPVKFDLVVNLKTAKSLGLTIPPSMLLRADRVIE